MRFCRLCGEYKTVEELVVSLDDPISILTFKEVVEYYCQLTLDPNSTLEQRACKTCKAALDRFAEFSCRVELHQKKLKTLPEIVIVKIDEDTNFISEEADEVEEIESEPEEQFEVVEVKQISKLDFVNENEEPPLKKTRPSDGNLLEEDLSESDEVIIISEFDREVQPLRRSRRKSVHEKTIASEQQKPATKESKIRKKHYENLDKLLEKVESLFNGENIHRCERIEVPETILKNNGEVPRNWLAGFANFKTWEDFKYVCNEHCNLQFNGFAEYSLHLEKVIRGKRSIQCHNCNQHFKGSSSSSSYINHISSEHYRHLKFCCVLCSSIFFNIYSLVKHYRTHHKTINLDIYPCLDCGAYKMALSSLKKHKAVHDK